MADPITGWIATGAAASVIQIVELAARLAKETYELINSADNSLKENKVVEELTVTYENLADQILALDDPAPTLDKAEQAINDLAHECKKVSSDLLNLLRELEIPKDSKGPRRAWQSARKAQMSLQKRKSIEQKQKYLNEICGQLSTAMLMQLKRGRVADLEQVFSWLSDTETKNASLVMQAKDTILSAIEGDISKKKCGLILNSLCFREMSLRRNAIPKAYEETFSWIFAGASPFQSWLTSHKDVFWITGKAGSGKSTLMKFASEDMRTQSLLSRWAGKNELVITRNYFWNPGLTMQRNEEGMLQEILFQILDSIPDLVAIATPRRWNADLVRLESAEPWSREELIQALMSVFEYSSSTTRYCLFVDGLDEYEGEHSRLVSTVVDLARYSNVKICISSRSWNVFCNAFDHLDDKICLHELTRPDIDIYVRKEVGKFLGASALADELSSAIIDKAQGVFFWVFLVVRSLREGYEEGDDADIMRQRIEEFPSDLEDYFRHILKAAKPNLQKANGQDPFTCNTDFGTRWHQNRHMGLKLLPQFLAPKYGPSRHAKRAVRASLATHQLLRTSGDDEDDEEISQRVQQGLLAHV